MISKFTGRVLVPQDIPLILVFAKVLFFTAEQVPQVQVFKDRPGDVNEVPELGISKIRCSRERMWSIVFLILYKHSNTCLRQRKPVCFSVWRVMKSVFIEFTVSEELRC